MNILLIVLRLLHIVAGAFWVGGSLVTSIFITPAAAATGEAGNQFMLHLVRNARFAARFAAAAGVTVLAGAALYWIDSSGLTSPWMRSGPGLGFGLGALLAIIGFVIGFRVGAVTRRLARVASDIRGKPTQGQVLELDATQGQIVRLRRAQDAFLVLALVCMATARYWGA